MATLLATVKCFVSGAYPLPSFTACWVALAAAYLPLCHRAVVPLPSPPSLAAITCSSQRYRTGGTPRSPLQRARNSYRQCSWGKPVWDAVCFLHTRITNRRHRHRCRHRHHRLRRLPSLFCSALLRATLGKAKSQPVGAAGAAEAAERCGRLLRRCFEGLLSETDDFVREHCLRLWSKLLESLSR